MKMTRNWKNILAIALAFAPWATMAYSATIPVTGWMVHNGSAAVGGTPSDPTITPGDDVTLMAPFADVVLANDGDFVEGKTTLTMSNRTGTGVNTLNTQIRFAMLVNSASGTVAASDFPNVGLIIEYSNVAAGGLIREQPSA